MIVILFETELILPGSLALNTRQCFVVATIMELLTIVIIPFALRLFKFKKINSLLTDEDQRWENLLSYGTMRILMLSVPMIVNTLCYYLFMSTAFAYLAIILFLCMFFVYPSVDKCVAETTKQ
ncbi:MAG: hypothetical protein ILA29_07790 [Prevotella sp.]|nr:hypothetical protein [Prevotella sp.]MBR1519459.1 hypothetical protein [Prevotella sp.]